MFSIHVDWQDEKWNFVGQSVYNSHYEELSKKEQEKADYYEDNERGMPMMNYAYPLHHSIDEDKILDIVENTNCTVVEDSDTGEYFLALTGGGMNLSQDIALAYIKAQGFIEWDLIDDVYFRSPLSVRGEDYKLIINDLKERYTIQAERAKEKLEEIKKLIK